MKVSQGQNNVEYCTSFEDMFHSDILEKVIKRLFRNDYAKKIWGIVEKIKKIWSGDTNIKISYEEVIFLKNTISQTQDQETEVIRWEKNPVFYIKYAKQNDTETQQDLQKFIALNTNNKTQDIDTSYFKNYVVKKAMECYILSQSNEQSDNIAEILNFGDNSSSIVTHNIPEWYYGILKENNTTEIYKDSWELVHSTQWKIIEQRTNESWENIIITQNDNITEIYNIDSKALIHSVEWDIVAWRTNENWEDIVITQDNETTHIYNIDTKTLIYSFKWYITLCYYEIWWDLSRYIPICHDDWLNSERNFIDLFDKCRIVLEENIHTDCGYNHDRLKISWDILTHNYDYFGKKNQHTYNLIDNSLSYISLEDAEKKWLYHKKNLENESIPQKIMRGIIQKLTPKKYS